MANEFKPETAQDQHNEVMVGNSLKDPQYLKDLMKEKEETSSLSPYSSQLVSEIAVKHGITNEEAIQMLKDFGV